VHEVIPSNKRLRNAAISKPSSVPGLLLLLLLLLVAGTYLGPKGTAGSASGLF
jgi:hypothetical protein